jgi:5-methyltetrahydrofolate--homocysteine methyltransferase
MSIAFSIERWQAVRAAYAAWWNGTLDRPLLHITLDGCATDRPAAAHPYKHFTAFYDLSIPADAVVDVWDYELSRRRYMGDGFPSIWPNFGPGVAAAFLGASLHCGNDTVWFHTPDVNAGVGEFTLNYAADNVWLRRIKDICAAAQRCWQGMVQVGMTDLGGTLDILSSFRPSERLLLDLYDQPDDVKRQTWAIHPLWHQYFAEINSVLQPTNPGYTAWTPIYSAEPYYMLQCDFAYMIGPAMFDEFVKPELAASCARIAHPFYHLDGPGQLPHVDSLVSIPELKGVQWIPGDGQPPSEAWPEVHKKIRAAGKLDQIFGAGSWDETMRRFDTIVDALGDARGLILIAGAPAARERDVQRFLERYGG